MNVASHKKLRGGGYDAIHKWLRKHYGKADRCENPFCDGKSKRYHWAKLTEAKYEHKRENFWMLCASCHRVYDQQWAWIERMANSLAARTNKNFCRNGHPRTPENTYWAKRKLVIAPVCRVCRSESSRRYYASRVA